MPAPVHASEAVVWREVLRAAEPLMEAPAVRRLKEVSFMGLLSPRYNDIAAAECSELKRRHSSRSDGSRATHSVGVAAAALIAARKLGIDSAFHRHVIAWGIVHDIATWPLSHSAEPAFTSILALEPGTIREWMILSDNRVPRTLHVGRELQAMGVDPDEIAALVRRDSSMLPTPLLPFVRLISSPLTPDTVDGIRRAGATFGIDVPCASNVYRSISLELFGGVVRSLWSSQVVSFWRAKGHVYDGVINAESVVAMESMWALTVRDAFRGIGLRESFELSEREVIAAVLRRPRLVRDAIFRYKPPQQYFVNLPNRKRGLTRDYSFAELDSVLLRRQKA